MLAPKEPVFKGGEHLPLLRSYEAAVGGKQAPFEGRLGMAPQTIGVHGLPGWAGGVKAASLSMGKSKQRGCLGNAGLPTSCAPQSNRSGWGWR